MSSPKTRAGEAWRKGYETLVARVERLPAALRATDREPAPPLDFDLREVRSFVTTGVGSSAAHARFLAHLLADRLRLPVRFVPVSELAIPRGREDEVLFVFSQGLSPNAGLALDGAQRWKRIVLSTAARDGVADLERTGVVVRRFEEPDEFGTLVRIIGPMCGYWTAVRIARELGTRLGAGDALPAVGIDEVCERIADAAPDVDPGWFDSDIAFLTSGTYGELTTNLRNKVLEGWLRPLPPVFDVLEMAHGPFQQAWPREVTFLLLSRADAPGERELVTRLRSMLDAGRHRLIALDARLPGPFAIFEHEAKLDFLLLDFIRSRHVDPADWPGRGEDEPLYGVGAGAAATRRLERLTWPEIERRIADGCRTAVVPLGATEQHGPHLPFATDAWIADALAERFCSRVPEAVQAPVLALGCSSEHMDFPGTVSLRPETLLAVLEDVLCSLRKHGFERAFVFSAHGGNYAALREGLPRLVAAAAPMKLIAFTDFDAVISTLARVAGESGVSDVAAGQHAGESETSMVLGLEPLAVRRRSLRAGRLEPATSAQAIFYPSLRVHAPDGTVGDPRGADAERAERYLACWVDLLVDAYRAAAA